MKYTWYINYIKCKEFGLKINQGAIMDLMTHLPLWAEAKEIEGEIYYYFTAQKIIEELPIISDKKRTILANVQVLKEKWLLDHKVYKNKGYYKLTELWKTFIFDDKKISVQNSAHLEEGMQKSTYECAENGIPGMQKNAYNNNTSNNNTEYNNIIINNTENKFSENSENEKIENFSDYEILEKENIQENTELSDLESEKNPAPAVENCEKLAKKEITENIDNLIIELKNLCNEVWVAYDSAQERNFARHILTAKEFWRFCENINQTRLEFAKNILKASLQINFWKICSWPKLIYKNYAEVYNKALSLKNNWRIWQVRQQSKIITI